MDLNAILTEYRFLIEIIYLFAIVIPAFYVFMTTNRLYGFSRHKGLKYFSWAFLFLAFAYIFRFMSMLNLLYTSGSNQTLTATFGFLVVLMEITILMPGFFLLYSLIWKKFHRPFIIPLYFVFAFLLVLIDFLNGTFLLMYITQIILFLSSSVISFLNWRVKPKPFRLTMFIILVLFLAVWVINFVGQYTIPQNPVIRLPVYVLTIFIAFTFMFMVKRLTKNF